MKFSPDELRRIVAVLDAKIASFVELSKLAGLDPACDFRGANLRFVNFGEDDLSDFDFSEADLRGANLSAAKGLSRLKMDAATKTDDLTRFPANWPKPSDQPAEADRKSDDAPASGAPDAAHGRHMPDVSNYQMTLLELGEEPAFYLFDGEAIPYHVVKETTSLDLNWQSYAHIGSGFHRDRARQFNGFHRISELKSLKNLTLDNTQIADLSALESCSRLVSLSLKHCANVQDISPVSKLVALATLSLDWTSVQDLSPLADLQALQDLSLVGCSVTDISPLQHLSNLRRLDISYTAIGDIAPLLQLKKLSELKVQNAKVAGSQRQMLLARNARLTS